MITMLELMTTFHDIDRIKGRVCGACEFYVPGERYVVGTKDYRYPTCRKGLVIEGPTDGCDDWQARVDRETRQLAAVVMSV